MVTIDKNALHERGRKIGSEGEGITLQIEKKAETLYGTLNTYIYLIMDTQLNIKDGTFISAIY